jgi:2'-5' RNA ligase
MSKPLPPPGPISKIFQAGSQATLAQPGIAPRWLTGALPGTLARTAIGAGAGLIGAEIASYINPNIDKRRTRNVMGLVGAGLGLATGVGDLASYPVNKWIGYGPYSSFGENKYSPHMPVKTGSAVSPESEPVTAAVEREDLDDHELYGPAGTEKMAGMAGRDVWVSFDLPVDYAEKIKNMADKIPKALVRSDKHVGKPHVTVLTNIDNKSFEAATKVSRQSSSGSVRLGRTKVFDRPDYDVVYVEAGSDALSGTHQKLKAGTDNVQTFPEYRPHVTLAYVRKGTGKYYTGMRDLEGVEIPMKSLQVSFRDGPSLPVKLKEPRDETMKIATYGDSAPNWFGGNVDNNKPFRTRDAVSTVFADPTMGVAERGVIFNMLATASQENNRPLITTPDLVRSAVGAGLGYVVGSLAGRALGAVFGLPESTRLSLARVGAVGGVLRSAGVWG